MNQLVQRAIATWFRAKHVLLLQHVQRPVREPCRGIFATKDKAARAAGRDDFAVEPVADFAFPDLSFRGRARDGDIVKGGQRPIDIFNLVYCCACAVNPDVWRKTNLLRRD